MNRYLLFVMTWLIAATTYAQSPLWKDVEKLESKSLPQSALETVNRIYDQALASGDGAEMIKAITYQVKYETAIDNDRLPQEITRIEQLVEQESRPAERSILQLLLANYYTDYCWAKAWRSDQRTAIEGDRPTDIREWSSSLFADRIYELVMQAVAPAKELQAIPATKYKQILQEGDDSKVFRPTLYDLVVQTGIRQLNDNWRLQNTDGPYPSPEAIFSPAKEFVTQDFSGETDNTLTRTLRLYQQLLSFRLTENNPAALLIADLDRLSYIYDMHSSEAYETAYRSALDDLEKQYTGQDICVEVLDKQAEVAQDEKDKYAICQKGIKTYPRYQRIGLLKNQLNNLTNEYLSASTSNTVYPDKDLELKLEYRNTDKVTVEIYRIKQPKISNLLSWDRGGLYQKQGTLMCKKEFMLPNKEPYLSSDTTLLIPMTYGLGSYEYVVYSSKGKKSEINNQFSVSRLAAISRTVGSTTEYLVVDRETGAPIPGAHIDFYRPNNSLLERMSEESVTTNELGLAYGSGESRLYYQVTAGEDKYLVASSVPWLWRDGNSDSPNELKVSLFTDRSIYRPGQTVHYKAIAYRSDKVAAGNKLQVSLQDPNDKEINSQTATTNEYGSSTGEFVIPKGLMNGVYSIKIDSYRTTFRVEEYKRPSFDITFQPNTQSYRFGDQIEVKGKAKTFSGVNLSEATVSYQVYRRGSFLFRYWPASPSRQIVAGEVVTDNDGSFAFSFSAERDPMDDTRKLVSYSYRVTVTLTDSNGETQIGEVNIPVGDRSMYLETGIKRVMNKETLPPVNIQSYNLSGEKIPSQGCYTLYTLQLGNETITNPKTTDWQKGEVVLTGAFEAGKPLDTSTWAALSSGQYRLLVETQDQFHREVTDSTDFVLASLNDRRPPVPVYDWFMTGKTECAVGEKAEILFGSAAESTYVLYEIYKGNERIAVERFLLTNENKKIELPFLEQYGKGVTVWFSHLKEGKLYSQSVDVTAKEDTKQLQLQMEVFRDRLLPGLQEEWKLSIKDAAGQPIQAELLAGMYDASLDKLYAHRWHFTPGITFIRPSLQISTGMDFNRSYDSWLASKPYIKVSPFAYDSFDWYGMVAKQRAMLRGSSMQKSMNVEFLTVDSADGAIDIADIQDHKVLEQEAVPKMMESGAGGMEDVQIRQQFNETAFFYPQLQTNAAGETLIAFTVPESNTTWKLMGLAHTKDLKYGQLIKEAISQKQLMVRPNIPRFMREGDQVTITTAVANLSETIQTGEVSLVCFDPNTDKSSFRIADNKQTFTVEAGKSTSVSWSFTIPMGLEMTAMKIVARSADYSDGEQHLVPILPNRILVTESLPLYVKGGEKREFVFEKMKDKQSKTLENYRLTLEFSSNPIWYAVQALPSMTTPQSDNVIDWFNAFYANSLATTIVQSTPRVHRMIRTWTAQGGTSETLLSQLEKNEELKNILLEETPWVIEASEESEQRQRLSLLFDVNRTANLNSQAIRKLQDLQLNDGSWSWFAGMSGSTSITNYMVYGLGQLAELGALPDNDEVGTMIIRAVDYIDREFKANFERMKKNNSDWKNRKTVNAYELEYLYARSFWPEGSMDKEAKTFFEGVIERSWTEETNLYKRSLMATVMHRSGKQATAQAIMQSFREHASVSDEMGMYWANNTSSAFFFQSATVNHTFIMEAFDLVGASAEEMDNMKLWLLKQKQTQLWESTPATASAAYILLKTGSNWLESSNNVAITLGKKKIDTSKGEAGTGYIKEAFPAGEIKRDMNKVTLNKTDAGPAWGALYWQYYEDLDKITAAATGLQVDKVLYVEQVTAEGKTIVSLNNLGRKLKVGDKLIVRLTIRSDCDMEYVQLKDLRASNLEPVDQLSGYRWREGLAFHQSPKDASMNYYFENLPKGTYVLEYGLYVTAPGSYSNGITTIQCLYAPEFVSHTAGGRLEVE